MARVTKVKVNRTRKLVDSKVPPLIHSAAGCAKQAPSGTVSFGGINDPPATAYPRAVNSTWELEDILKEFLGTRQKFARDPETLSHILNARQLFASALKSLHFADSCGRVSL